MLSQLTYYIAIGIVIATPITGIILLIDHFFFKKKRKKEDKLPFLVDWSKFLFPVVLIVSVLRSFVAEPYIIPSGSMQPTLYAGDMIIANKWSYGLRYPIINKRIFSEVGDGIKRGDIAIFKFPEDEKINYIKRIVGLPGDTIDYKDKKLTINGIPLEYTYVSQAREPEHLQVIKTEKMLRTEGPVNQDEPLEYIEYHIQQLPYITTADHGLGLRRQFPFTIPKGEYLAFGDNRDNSLDGRFWGMVKDDQILGKANFIWMNYNCVTSFTDCHRIFTKIQ